MRLTIPRGYLLPATLVAACALLLAWWQPWRILAASPGPTPVIAPPSPAPTAAATRAPDRIALPSATPITSAAPRPTPPATQATPAASGTPVAPTGTLLYLGVAGDRPGIVAVNADGSGRRLLAPGVYVALAWSPDGARFAALGGNGYEQLAIFAADGRPLARYPVRAGTQCDLRWSPDSQHAVCIPAYPFNGRERTTILIADDTGLREALLPPVVRAAFLGWPAPGVLGLAGYPEEFPYAAADVWTVALRSGQAERPLRGDFLPLGWSADTRTLLAFGGRQPRGGTSAPGEPVFTELIAVDTDTGERRTVQRADQVARVLTGTTPGTRHWFNAGLLSPDGLQLALWVEREPAAGTPIVPVPAPNLTFAILGLSIDGTLSAITAVRPAEGSSFSYGWSSNSQVLASTYRAQRNGVPALSIVSRTTPAPLIYPLADHGNPAVTWSPDGRWFAYIGPQGLTVAATFTTQTVPLDPQGSAPAWRPTPR